MSSVTLTQRKAAAAGGASKAPSSPPPSTAWYPGVRGVPAVGVSNPSLKQYRWEEVATHNTLSSLWVYNGNKVYDITNFVSSHPGGSTVLKLIAGRDITDMLPSYHPFSLDKVLKTLAPYQIGEMITTELPQYKEDSGFYRELREEVGNYFKKTGKYYKDPKPGLLRLTFMIVVAIILYLFILGPYWSSTPLSIRIILSIVFGIFQALPLLHCMHDASHTSIGSSQRWWSSIGRFCMDWYGGASLTSWLHQHIVGHHIYTNVIGADPDLPMEIKGDIRRVSPIQQWAILYKFQHLYLLFLYGVLALKFRIQDITDTLIAQTNGPIRVNINTTNEIIWSITTKLVWSIWRIFIPLYYFQVSSMDYWICFFISEWMTGYYLTFNFQVSHISPELAFPDTAQTASFIDEWAIAQMKSTIDYAHNHWLSTFLCGALNYQVVHHLFPSVSQYHYPAIAPIVKKVADKYGIRYHVVDSFGTAFYLHLMHLKNMGTSEVFRYH